MRLDFIRKEVLDSRLYGLDPAHGIKLNQNESPWDLPIELKVRIIERLLVLEWNRYPLDELVVLQKKLAKIHGVLADQVVVSNGSNTIIQALIQILKPAAKVMIPDPTFIVYELQARLHGNPVVKFPLSEEFELQIEKTLTLVQEENPALIFLPNPNAPTGSLFDKSSLARLLKTAKCPVVIDEAYFPFAPDSVVDWISEYDNLVVLRTLSKAFALAGVRFGYMLANADLASCVERFLMSFRLSRHCFVVVDEVLSHPDYMLDVVNKLNKERTFLFGQLQLIKKIRVYPSDTNFLLIRCENARELERKLAELGILIRNVSQEGRLANCLRISVGKRSENEALLSALRTALDL